MAALDTLDAFDGHDSWDFRESVRAAMAPAERAAAEAAQEFAAIVPARTEPRRERRVSTTPPLCNRCGRTRSERDIPYPFGWSPEWEGQTEDEVPMCCTHWLQIGSDDDKAMREIECLKWAKTTGWIPIPEPPPDPACKFCHRLRGVECHREETTGSEEDRAARRLECATFAAGL